MGYNDSFYKGYDWEKEIYDLLPEEILDYLGDEIEFYKDTVGASDIVLDVGCGTGRIMKELYGLVAEIHGIDINAGSVKCCKEIPADCPLYIGTITKTPYRDSCFDTVLLSFNLLGNLNPEKEAAIGEIKRILKPRGNVLFSVYSENARKIQEKMYKTFPGVTTVYSAENSNEKYTHADTRCGDLKSERFSEEDLRLLFESEGFYLELIENDFTYFGRAKLGNVK